VTELCSAARVIKTISTGDVGVLGVTSVDDELFVLLDRNSDQVAVYSINDYRLLRYLSLYELKGHSDNDLTSCVRHRCLYASDYDNECVHRYDLASDRSALRRLFSKTTRKWPVPGSPCGLSVTPSANLLVTCWWSHKVVELSADSGQCVREIALQSNIHRPHHAVQLTTGQYVVCNGDILRIHSRVCIVDDDGRVTSSYGGQEGSGVGQLELPLHLAVDEDSQFVFVADCCNNRVVVLSPTLEFVHYISEGLSRPCQLHFDNATTRLYVSQTRDDIVVIQL